jgi:3-deoxy-manno-octulosonate cytidylyltransferase (CMP-KDO synthetase)
MVADFAIIIPARYASQRFPGKPLAELRGVDGQPRSLIQRSWDAAQAIAGPARTWVATDDTRIAEAVQRFGGQVVMTPQSCCNGTERCAAALDV